MGRMGIHNPTAYCTQSPRTERGHTVIQHTRFIHGCFSVQGAYKRKQIMGSYGHTSHTYTILLHPTPSNLDPTAYTLKPFKKKTKGHARTRYTYTVVSGSKEHTDIQYDIQKKTHEWGHTPPFCTQSPSLDPTYTTTLHLKTAEKENERGHSYHTRLIHGCFSLHGAHKRKRMGRMGSYTTLLHPKS